MDTPGATPPFSRPALGLWMDWDLGLRQDASGTCPTVGKSQIPVPQAQGCGSVWRGYGTVSERWGLVKRGTGCFSLSSQKNALGSPLPTSGHFLGPEKQLRNWC